ncbi:MAG: hypothetical protein JNM43_15190 [Planctomycetaceae bacterium]|nr:hypothetical protein [Planctomycetaceae bacterium]
MKRYAEDDWEDESFDDDAGELHPEDDDSDDNDTIICPSCGASMYEDSPRCPSCGDYPSREVHPPTKPPWILLTGALCLLLVLTWLLI